MYYKNISVVPAQIISPTPSDPRILFNPNLEGLDLCNLVFNTEASNEQIDYQDLNNKISFKIPFNKNWGNAQYKLASFEKYKENGIEFGQIISGVEGCGVTRKYDYSPQAKRSIENIQNEEKQKGGQYTQVITKNVLINGQNSPVVFYLYDGMAESVHAEVVGSNNNYVFSSFGSNLDDTSDLESIIQTVQFQ